MTKNTEISNDTIQIKVKKYISNELNAQRYTPIRKEFKKLMKKPIKSTVDLIWVIKAYTELYEIVEDELLIKTAKYFCNMNKKKPLIELIWYGIKILIRSYIKRYKFYKYIYEHEVYNQLGSEYDHLKKLIETQVKLKPINMSNLIFMAKELYLTNKYSSKYSKIQVKFNDEMLSLQKLEKIIEKDKDREKREKAWNAYYGKLLEIEPQFNKIFNKLLKSRVKMANKMGYNNARDYYHNARGRFDYTPNDIYTFHNSVEKIIVPFVRELNQNISKYYKLDKMRPWDEKIDIFDKELKPYNNLEDLSNKMIIIFTNIDKDFGRNLQLMKNSGFLDLDNRKGKIPGGMSLPLADHGASIIIQNAVGIHRDVETLSHEGGHAMHNFSEKELEIAMYKENPSEIAELASMTMEFLIFNQLHEYYKTDEEIKQVKRKSLEDTIRFLPYCMTIDAFQQWIYTHPEHTVEERMEYFSLLVERFNESTGIDWTGLEKEKPLKWLRQTHVFQDPFYYIEYGIAQIGAIAMYRNYKKDPYKTIQQYKSFLKLGNSKPMKELYEAAGIKFDFSEDYIKEILDFVKEELLILQ